MKRDDIYVPGFKEMNDKTLLAEGGPTTYGFGGRGFAHCIVTEGGKMMQISGCVAAGEDGLVGKNDMAAQTTQALENLRITLEAGGATWDDLVHMIFIFTDRQQYWDKCLPARIEYFKKHSKTGKMPCVTAFGTTGLMHPDIMLEILAFAVF